MHQRPETVPWGLFALVAYIPEPLGSCLHDIRRSLPGTINSQAHITVLPPRPLSLPLENASRLVQQVLSQFQAFEVEFSTVGSFPETNTIYLNVSDGEHSIYALHRELNSGELAHSEEFEFHPHATLGGPCEPGEVSSVEDLAQSAWLASGCVSRFMLNEVVFLWASPGSAQGEWRRLWTLRLADSKGNQSIGASI